MGASHATRQAEMTAVATAGDQSTPRGALRRLWRGVDDGHLSAAMGLPLAAVCLYLADIHAPLGNLVHLVVALAWIIAGPVMTYWLGHGLWRLRGAPRIGMADHNRWIRSELRRLGRRRYVWRHVVAGQSVPACVSLTAIFIPIGGWLDLVVAGLLGAFIGVLLGWPLGRHDFAQRLGRHPFAGARAEIGAFEPDHDAAAGSH